MRKNFCYNRVGCASITYLQNVPKVCVKRKKDYSNCQILVPDRATQNSNTRRVLTLKTQPQLNSSSKKLEKLVLLEPKLEILKQNSSLIHIQTRQFETRQNLTLLKSELDLALPNTHLELFCSPNN